MQNSSYQFGGELRKSLKKRGPLVQTELSQALRTVSDVYLVTQVRNRGYFLTQFGRRQGLCCDRQRSHGQIVFFLRRSCLAAPKRDRPLSLPCPHWVTTRSRSCFGSSSKHGCVAENSIRFIMSRHCHQLIRGSMRGPTVADTWSALLPACVAVCAGRLLTDAPALTPHEKRIRRAGAKLLGPITVVDNSVMWANAVVLDDVSAKSIPIGMPAVIKSRLPQATIRAAQP